VRAVKQYIIFTSPSYNKNDDKKAAAQTVIVQFTMPLTDYLIRSASAYEHGSAYTAELFTYDDKTW